MGQESSAIVSKFVLRIRKYEKYEGYEDNNETNKHTLTEENGCDHSTPNLRKINFPIYTNSFFFNEKFYS